jgi:hypothetical protein
VFFVLNPDYSNEIKEYMDITVISQSEAQKRVEQIHAFTRELAQLKQQDIVSLTPQQSAKIATHHLQLTSDLSNIFDIDTNVQSQQLSLGMKIASLAGALAMASSLFFLFYQFWGHLTTITQASVLVISPLLLFILTLTLADKEKHAYFSKMSALVCFASFVLNISMLGQIFNITPSPNAFVTFSAFAFLLAYTCNTRLMLIFAVGCACSFIAMRLGTWSGIYWLNFGERPENFFIPGILLFIIGYFGKHKQFNDFSSTYRITALMIIFLPILVLANWAQISYLTFPNEIIEGSYQTLGFTLSAALIWLGIKQQKSDVTNTANVFLLLFIYTKFFDWWWDLMPKYVFFFLVGLSALLALLVFKRIRNIYLSVETHI